MDQLQFDDIAPFAEIQQPTSFRLRSGSLEQQRAQSMAKSLEPTDPNAPAPPKGGNVGGYNSFFGDSGEVLAKVKGQYRTTWLLNSENGQLPYSPQGKRLFDSQLAFTRNNFDGPEARPMAERCVVGFGSTGGPPMINVLYNNNYQIVQSKDTVVILVEMIMTRASFASMASIDELGQDMDGRFSRSWKAIHCRRDVNFPGESLRTNSINRSMLTQSQSDERLRAPRQTRYCMSSRSKPDVYSRHGAPRW